MTISFTGLSSVIDRTVFTNRGPIVKPPLSLLSGGNLSIISASEVVIPTGNFTSLDEKKNLIISGSPGGRNDGTFVIVQVKNSTTLVLADSNFDNSNVSATTLNVIALANNIKAKFNSHRSQAVLDSDTGIVTSVHGTNDNINLVVSFDAFDLASAITLLNEIKTNFDSHILITTGSPPTHLLQDVDNSIESPNATSLNSSLILANELRKNFELHRQNFEAHQVRDTVDYVSVPVASVIINSGPLVGPFLWTLQNPRIGIFADDSTDVNVLVNSLPASIDAVFGLLGAIVLSSKPVSTDTVTVDYQYLNNPATTFSRLNSSEFLLNQFGTNGHAGLPAHQYRSRSVLVKPRSFPEVASPFAPKRVGWKYKGLERKYSAVLNDPNTLLLNVPTNKVAYPVFDEFVPETVIRYDPTTLPQNSTDPWTLNGQGVFSLAPGGRELTIIDTNFHTGTGSLPPFFSHSVDLSFPNTTSAAFRGRIETFTPDGVFTGVSFGISDGTKVAILGFIQTTATNLSSALAMTNDLKKKFNKHLSQLSVHYVNDPTSSVLLVDATNIEQLMILLNNMKAKFNSHIIKTPIHLVPDTIDGITLPDVGPITDVNLLQNCINLVNDMRIKFNSHRDQVIGINQVHQNNDGSNPVGLIKQAGFLSNKGPTEFEENWISGATDWTITKTYRISKNEGGDFAAFLSGSPTPLFSATNAELPALSDIDADFNPAQQVFFGSIGKESVSNSKWNFIRVDISPLDSNQISDNKSVDYSSSTVPEVDPAAPWITIGQGGCERIVSGIPNTLVLDSTDSSYAPDIPTFGLTSGAYRGFLRLEPMISASTTIAFEFKGSVDYYTFGVDDKAAGVFIDDGFLQTHLAFIQFSPRPASITSTTSELFSLLSTDTLILSINGGPQITVNFSPGGILLASVVASKINATAGIPAGFASGVSGKLQLTTTTSGEDSNIVIIGGSTLVKFGFIQGTYFGFDSTPEPRVSYFGANFPDLDTPLWTQIGSQSATMLGRILRIIDTSPADFLVYSQSSPLVVPPALNVFIDWKLDARITVQSFTPSVTSTGGAPLLYFAGALVSLDEGPSGKNLELHLSVDGSSNPYVNVVSYDSGPGTFVMMTQVPFDWKDEEPHTYNLYTDKGANIITLFIDSVMYSSFSYSALKTGISGPSIVFGSGSSPVGLTDIQTSESVVDWHSIAVFKDSKISDPTAASRRYIGLYKGGNPASLKSYYLHQIDWTSLHIYRIVRDPVDSVSVFIDTNQVPSISVNYDTLRLPPESTSFFEPISEGIPIVAFGSFNSVEISRTRWEYIRYSIGKIITLDRIIAPHQLLNQANPIASPDHLFTKSPHNHFGRNVYSGGTPSSEFLADPAIPSFTILGEGTPPVPMTQNLESRGGLVKDITETKNISPTAFVDSYGFLSNYDNDDINIVETPVIDEVIALSNDLKSKYNTHRTQIDIHAVNDATNSTTAPDASSLASAITLLNNIKLKYNSHRASAVFHIVADTINIVSSPNATDISSAVVLANEIRTEFINHIDFTDSHLVNDIINIVSTVIISTATAIDLANEFKTKYRSHLIQAGVHFFNESSYAINSNLVKFTGSYGSSDGTTTYTDTTTFSKSPPPSVPPNHPSPPDFISLGVVPGYILKVVSGAGAGFYEVLSVPTSNTLLLTSAVPIDIGPASYQLIDFISFVNEAKQDYNKHRIQLSVHQKFDTTNIVVMSDATSVATAKTLLSDIKDKYNAHRVINSSHNLIDYGNKLLLPEAEDPTTNSINIINKFKNAFNSHLIQNRVHINDDTINIISTPDAVDLSTAIALTNEAVLKYSAHVIQTVNDSLSKVHTNNDVPISGVAVDLPTLVNLLNYLVDTYNFHRTNSYAHGVSVIIKLNPPDRVLYEGMEFFEFPIGDDGHLSPFSDDETLHMDGFKFQGDTTFSYDGTFFPENVSLNVVLNFATEMKRKFNAHIIQPDVHVINDIVNVISNPDAVDLSTTIILLNELKDRFNAHRTYFGVHVLDDTTDIVLASNAVDLPTSIALMNDLQFKYETHRTSTTYHISVGLRDFLILSARWRTVSDDPANVATSLTGTALRYGTVGPGTRTAYRNDITLPDVSSLNFDWTVKIQINSFPPGSVDSGIYAGFTSNAGPGVSAAIGFDSIQGIRYVKMQDVNSNTPVFRAPFNWGDGLPHTYKIVRDIKTNSFQLIIVS